MTRNLLLLILATCFLQLKAQLPDNSIAPNFNATDINGNPHNLYAYLDSGYTVILDLSAAWCGPCWTVHQTGLLQDIHDQYGPNGTNEMRVFYIESESANTLDQLNGIGTNGGGANRATDTHGDWVGSHTYPFIDNASIGNAYQLNAFPTIYAICPERLTRVFVGASDVPSVQDFYNIATSCNGVADLPIDPLMLNYSGDNTSICGSLDASVVIQNHGTNNLTSATIDLIQNGNVIATENWTGNLATYATTTIQFSNVTITSNDSIDAVITSNDDDVSNNEIKFNVDLLNEQGVSVVEGMEDGTFGELPSDVYYFENDFDVYSISKDDLRNPPTYELGGFGNSSKSLMFDFYNNSNGEKASILFDKLNIPLGVDAAELSFNYAYTNYSNESDRLNIEVSIDCGNTWTSVFNKAGTALQTAPATTSLFLPNTTQWKNEVIDLSNYSGEVVSVRFTGTSNYGNSLFVDDVNMFYLADNDGDGYDTSVDCDDTNAAVNPGATEIPGNGIDDDCNPATADMVGINDINFASDLILAPVPTNNYINISFTFNELKNVEISIVSLEGKLLSTTSFNDVMDVNESFNTSNLSNGIYLMKIDTENATTVRKFVVAH